MAKLGRNDPCHCGSGKKYKKCCLARDEAREAEGRAAALTYEAARAPLWDPVLLADEDDTWEEDDFDDDFEDDILDPPRRKRRQALTLPTAPLDQSPVLVDFAPGIDLEQVEDAIERLTLDWVGTVHQRYGVALDQLGPARGVLEVYLEARADGGARSRALLVPVPAELEGTLWDEADSEPVATAAFLGLLPTYIEYLADGGIIDADSGVHILPRLRRIREIVLRHMRDKSAFATVMGTVEPIPWPEPKIRADGAVPPDLVPLLNDLGVAGEHADRDLLDRIVEYGSGAIPALIDLATDEQLLFPGGDGPQTWAPVHAVQLLGEMRAQEAIEPLLPLLEFAGDEYISMRLRVALGAMGPAVLPHLLPVFLDRENDHYLRARAADIISTIGKHNAETREGVVQALQAELDASEDPVLTSLIIAGLTDMQALEAMPSIERAYDEDRVDYFIVGDIDNVRQEMLDPGSTTRELLAQVGVEEK